MNRVFVCVLILCGAAALRAQSPVVADGAKVTKAADGFAFTEGPAADAEGNVYFTDQPNDRIVKWSAADGTCSDFMKPSGRSNGLCFDAKGNLIACADEKNEMWSIDVKTKKVTVLFKDFEGKLLNAPNDVWVAPSGVIYFTDPMYARKYWTRDPKPQQDKQCVYMFKDGKLTRLIDDLKQPNGIIGTADGKTVYVADIGAKKTYRYDVAADGKLANKAHFCDLGSDGMTIDTDGNVYLTGKGVSVFDKSGKKIEQIDVPEGWTANVCFGGKDMQTLVITASKGLYTVKTKTRGAGSQ